jgi:tRNA U38,U39,U40 pseudouridine synthase TruA
VSYRSFCFDRTYEYYLPAYLLLGPRSGAVVQYGGAAGDSAASGSAPAPGPQDMAGQAAAAAAAAAAAGAGAAAGTAAEMAEAEALRAALSSLREALGCFVGTHPFHNYTTRRKMYVETAKDKGTALYSMYGM